MPVHVGKPGGGGCKPGEWPIVETATGKTVACATSQKNAEATARIRNEAIAKKDEGQGMFELKSFPAEFKVVGAAEGRILEGYAGVFGNVDLGGDILESGAFKKTLAERSGRVKVLFNHDPDKIIGKPLHIEEDSKGLFTRTQLARTPLGEEVRLLAEDGMLTDMSFGYKTIKAQRGQKGGQPTRSLLEVKLIEYSAVTFGMNELAGATGLKSEEFDLAVKSYTALLQEVKEGRILSGGNLERVRAAHAALAELLALADPGEGDTEDRAKALEILGQLAEIKFNDEHDELGRFASGGGGSASGGGDTRNRTEIEKEAVREVSSNLKNEVEKARLAASGTDVPHGSDEEARREGFASGLNHVKQQVRGSDSLRTAIERLNVDRLVMSQREIAAYPYRGHSIEGAASYYRYHGEVQARDLGIRLASEALTNGKSEEEPTEVTPQDIREGIEPLLHSVASFKSVGEPAADDVKTELKSFVESLRVAQ